MRRLGAGLRAPVRGPGAGATPVRRGRRGAGPARPRDRHGTPLRAALLRASAPDRARPRACGRHRVRRPRHGHPQPLPAPGRPQWWRRGQWWPRRQGSGRPGHCAVRGGAGPGAGHGPAAFRGRFPSGCRDGGRSETSASPHGRRRRGSRRGPRRRLRSGS
ncbi:hypothetical protein ACFFX0_13600 [Citricoccus parietis]|uniref:Uncharacterized protein n=1 Tax=Citricoccus parietis TaxID=592307 RepID=A0ABV5FZT9_9MICC